MVRQDMTEPRFQPNGLQCIAAFRRPLKWAIVLFGFLTISAILLYTGKVIYRDARRAKMLRERKETTGKFSEIAYSLKSYSDFGALGEFERSHPCVPGKGLLLADVPWGTGRLPSPAIRERMTTPEVVSAQQIDAESYYSYSWRYALFPFLIGVGRFLHWDEPWYAPVNRKVIEEYGSFFEYGEANHSAWLRAADRPISDTIALAITGPGTAWGDGTDPPMRLNEVPAAAILVVEVRASGIPWPAPGDFDIRTMPQTINAPDGKGISSRHAGGFHVIFGDLEVWFLSDQVPFDTLRKFFTVAEAKQQDREKLLGPYALDRWRLEGSSE